VASQVRADARRFWPAWLALGLFVGLAFGAVMAASATARRTDTAYQRLVRAWAGPHARRRNLWLAITRKRLPL
ncbi:MAG: hypothetical protein HY953_04855, partial [Candidatus Rokubacteria bacterium]|nr:hypothetical protein [Candidatus Rokubacteria bacterium]